jgi:hypothetical protein
LGEYSGAGSAGGRGREQIVARDAAATSVQKAALPVRITGRAGMATDSYRFLFVEDLFDVSDLFLELAFGLVGMAFRLETFVTYGFAGGLLDFSADVFAGTFCFVLVA